MTKPKRQKAEKFGRNAEDIAALFLRAKGYELLNQRYKTPHGEIDLVMERDSTIIFIEVKARAKQGDWATALESINQTRIANAALIWISKNPNYSERDMRFDVLLLTPNQDPHHLENAFMAA